MKFYNRESELVRLREMRELSYESSKMTIVVGRRRIGKTKLIKEAFEEKAYFFVSKKSEGLLCQELITIIEIELNIKIHGAFDRFPALFAYIMELSVSRAFTLVIDEFQEFLHINGSIYSEIQNVWDEYKDKSKLNLVLCGSIYSLMRKIFEDKKEPLFGRADAKIHLKPFSTVTLKKIISENKGSFSNDDLLAFYMFTGGVAKYVEIFVDAKAFTLQKQLDLIFSDYSLFLEEGKNILIEEFGKEYTVYFSILSLLASSKTSRVEIESVLQRDIGGYLKRLENEYMIIKKVRPIFSKEGGRVMKYEISDNFLNFWFRFIYKNKSAIEIENYEYVKNIVKRDYFTYSGKFLEKYFFDQLVMSKEYSMIGSYWEKRNQNEIDIVAINDRSKTIVYCEVKRQSKNISLPVLKDKSLKIVNKFKKYKSKYKCFTLADM